MSWKLLTEIVGICFSVAAIIIVCVLFLNKIINLRKRLNAAEDTFNQYYDEMEKKIDEDSGKESGGDSGKESNEESDKK